MLKLAKVLVFGGYIILALIVTRNLLLTPGTIGHNWDWLIPPRVDYLQELFKGSFFTWQNSNLGESRIFQLPSLPLMIFILSPSFFGVGGDLISKLLVITTIVVAGMGMFLLLENMTGFTFAPFLGGFFYAFSPFLFADFIGGAATQFFAYALLPWLIFFVRRLNQEKKEFWLYLLLSTFVLSLITISLQVLVLSSLVLGLYLLIQDQKRIYLKNLILLYISYFFLNLYWILPTTREYIDLSKVVFSSGFFEITPIKINVPSLWEIFVATGYWRPLFLYSIKPMMINLWLAISYLVVIFILATNFLIKKNKESIFWLLVLLVSFILATGGKEPMGDQVLWLYLHFPLMSLFRSPQHLLVVPILAFAVLLGLGIASIRPVGKKKYLQGLLFLGVVFWLHPFFLYGDVGAKYLRQQQKDHLDLFQPSPSYQQAFDFLHRESKNSDFRILFLPMSSSPRYLKTEYQNEGQGGDPLVVYSPYGTLVSDINYNPNSKKLSELLEKNLYERENSQLIDKILTLLNIKYILLRKDVIPEFSDNKEIWSPERINNYLQTNSNIKKILSFDDLEVFENLTFQPGVQIIVTGGAVVSNDNPASIFDGIALNSFDAQKEILVSGYGRKRVSPEILNKSNIFMELLPSNPEHKIINQSLFDFTLPVDGNYELLLEKEDYSDNFEKDPLSPLSFSLDGLSIVRNPLGEENGWFSYGELNLFAGEHNLEIIVPETLSLLYDASFEEGTWIKKPEASLTLDRADGNKALRLTAQGSSVSVSQEIKNIKPKATYKISFFAKTINGEPPHMSVFQDTDVVRNGKVIPKVNHYMEKNSSYNHFETKLRTNIDTQKVTLYLWADPPQGKETTTLLYDDVKAQRLFTSSVFLRQKDQKATEDIPLPKMNFKRLNSTKYLIEVQDAQAPYYLTFAESFSSQWKIFPLQQQETEDLALLWKNWFRQSLFEDNHYLANYYANAWYIDQKGDYKFIIEYRPQRLFYLGGLVSLIFLFSFLGIVARSLIK